jgi:hypothetical protein
MGAGDNFKYTVDGQGACVKTNQCKSDDYELKYQGSSMSCVLKETASEENQELLSEQYCWETLFTQLWRSDGYKCKDNQWVPSTLSPAQRCQSMASEGCSECIDLDHVCYDINTGNSYRCNHPGDLQTFRWGPDCETASDVTDEIIALQPKVIPAGTQCLDNNGRQCLCDGGIDTKVSEGLWCREVATKWNNQDYCGLPDTLEDKVCDKFEGKTCIKHEDYAGYYCYGDPPEISVKTNNITESIFSLLYPNKAFAQTGSSADQYLIDFDTGIFVDIPPGSYIFEYEGEYYSFENSLNGDIFIYIDMNDNNQFDDGIDIQVSEVASEIFIIPLEQSFLFELNEGLNFVSFPFLVSSPELRSAAALLHKLNEVYGDTVFSISKFNGGTWKMVGQNSEVYDNNDFQLLPGQGYVIKAKEDIDIRIAGQPVQFESESDSAPINLNTGWNLIGLYGTNVKSYTAKSLLEDINTYDFRAINVTQWAKSKQLYEGFQLVDGKEYGFDYPLNKLESYFVRITEGSGKWEPQLGSNN